MNGALPSRARAVGGGRVLVLTGCCALAALLLALRDQTRLTWCAPAPGPAAALLAVSQGGRAPGDSEAAAPRGPAASAGGDGWVDGGVAAPAPPLFVPDDPAPGDEPAPSGRAAAPSTTGQLAVPRALPPPPPAARASAQPPVGASRGRFGAVCADWSCRVEAGVLPRGAPYVRMSNVCVRNRGIRFLPFDAADVPGLEARLAACCVPGATERLRPPLTEAYCAGARRGGPLCYRLQLYDMAISIAGNATVAAPPSPLLRGRTYLLDTAITGFYQFGHSISKIVQFAVLGAAFDAVVLNRMGRLPGGNWHGMWENHTRGVFDFTVGAAGGAPIVLTGPGETCAAELWSVPHYERPVFSPAGAAAWRAAVAAAGLPTPPASGCPPGRAILLSRGDESSARGFANAGVLHAVAAEFGVPRLEAVRISSLNSTAEHAALFASAGLVVSGHSSQLKNALFAGPHAAVIELNGEHLADGKVSPFEEGAADLGLHFVVSRHHWANWTACGRSCVRPVGDRDAPLTLNATLLRAAFAAALGAQRTACPGIRYS